MIYLDVLVFIVFMTLFLLLCFTVMINTLTDLICLEISMLLIFLMFWLSDFIINSQSNVDIISKSNLAFYHNKISLPH